MNMKLNIVIGTLIFLILNLSACDRKPASSQYLHVVFGEHETGTELYQTRVIVTPEFMRFDDGQGATDFVLFDRQKKVIYSITPETKQIMMIEDTATTIPPEPGLKLSNVKIDDMEDAPTLNGKKPGHYKFKAGEETCFETLSIAGFLPAYVEALQEFNRILAKDSMATLVSMPADLHNNCDLAKNTFAPSRHLQRGFPVRFWDANGFSSTLLNFEEDYAADKLLFELPADYVKLSVTQMRQNASASNVRP